MIASTFFCSSNAARSGGVTSVHSIELASKLLARANTGKHHATGIPDNSGQLLAPKIRRVFYSAFGQCHDCKWRKIINLIDGDQPGATLLGVECNDGTEIGDADVVSAGRDLRDRVAGAETAIDCHRQSVARENSGVGGEHVGRVMAFKAQSVTIFMEDCAGALVTAANRPAAAKAIFAPG